MSAVSAFNVMYNNQASLHVLKFILNTLVSSKVCIPSELREQRVVLLFQNPKVVNIITPFLKSSHKSQVAVSELGNYE